MSVSVGSSGNALFPPDAFDVPVFVRRSSPLAPAPHPTIQQVADAWMTWPAALGVPPDGDYLVSTTWREILNAAISVGRDIAPWLTQVPELARREILARRSPLAAYLVRQRTSGGRTGGSAQEVLPSVIFSHATESSMRTAFGYHIGMTMAEWACRAQMGLGPTTHAENACPFGAVGWKTSKSLPDLFGTHPATGDTWLIEAKGGRWLNEQSRRKGATQLDVGHLLPTAHHKVLCATALQRRLHMAIDVEKWSPPQPRDTADAAGAELGVPLDEGAALEYDDGTLLALAHSKLLVYLALKSIPSATLSLVAVGAAGSARRGRGLVRLLERDNHTEELRGRLGEYATGRQIRMRDGQDMLVGSVPSTDLILGMSRRLFGACEALSTAEGELAQKAAYDARSIHTARDDERPYGAVTPDEQQSERSRRELRLLHDARREYLQGVAREGFSKGADREWESLIDLSPRLADPGHSGYLEAATSDTYLAVRSDSLALERA